jgi:hypothetical protein
MRDYRQMMEAFPGNQEYETPRAIALQRLGRKSGEEAGRSEDR